MSLLGKTDSRHSGDSLPFWEQACVEQRSNACQRLVLLKTSYCGDGSGWACNELGAYYMQAQHVEQDMERAMAYFSRACELRFRAACLNLLEPGRITVAQPRELDLRLLLREGGLNLMQMPERELYVRACEHGWAFACEKV
jgi:TPR repeat protein